MRNRRRLQILYYQVSAQPSSHLQSHQDLFVKMMKLQLCTPPMIDVLFLSTVSHNWSTTDSCVLCTSHVMVDSMLQLLWLMDACRTLHTWWLTQCYSCYSTRRSRLWAVTHPFCGGPGSCFRLGSRRKWREKGVLSSAHVYVTFVCYQADLYVRRMIYNHAHCWCFEAINDFVNIFFFCRQKT